MKCRVLVMNGQRIVQQEQADGGWSNEHVDKAGALKPGIYNIYLANGVDKSKTYNGAIIHVDKNNVYQQIEKQYVVHNRELFDKVPDVGGIRTIAYDQEGRAQTSISTEKQARKLSR